MGAKEILFKADKRGKQRAYTYSRGQMRWFPMPLEDAKLAVATGTATEIALADCVVAPGTPRGW